MTIYQACDLYLAECARQGKSPKTRDRYRRHFEKLGDMFPHYDVDEITTVMLRRFLDRWAENAPATSAQIVSMLRKFFGWLEKEDIIPADPALRLERPGLPRPEEQDDITSLTREQDQRMLTAAVGWVEILTLNLLAFTGARRGAVAQLHRRDYDPEVRELTFREKGGKTITKAVPDELCDLLDAAIASGLYESPDDYLVPPEAPLRRSGPRDDKIIWKIVKRVAKRVGIEAHVHAFRAAFAVYFLETKPDKLVALNALLGHSNLETTRIYLRRLDRKKAMEEVRDLSWGQPTMFPVLAGTEKEGFEPSLDALPVTEREAVPHSLVSVLCPDCAASLAQAPGAGELLAALRPTNQRRYEMEDLDRDRIVELLTKRAESDDPALQAYFAGAIEPHCTQVDIDEPELRSIAQRYGFVVDWPLVLLAHVPVVAGAIGERPTG